MARLFVAIGGLIVLVLSVALVGPYFVDWTSYRADFEREASVILGRKVTVNGAAEARLLPFPSVTFSDVSVGAGAGGEPAMTIETFSMDAELAPFLHGEFLIFDMRMVRPKALVQVGADGTIDWSVRPSAPIAINNVALEKLTITDGRLEVRHGLSGRTHLVTDINAAVSAKSLAGPWRIDATAKLDGKAATLSISSGVADQNGGIRLRVKAQPEGTPLVVDAEGEARFAETGLAFDGTFRLAQTPARAEAVDDVVVQAKTDPGSRANGRFRLDNGGLDVPEFRFESGPLEAPYTADGRANVTFDADPRFVVEAKGAQVRFDEAIGAGGGALTLERRVAALEAALLALPRPTMPGTVTVDLPAVVVGDTTVRDVRLSAEPAAGGWVVKSAAATLPGRTTLEADGFLGTDGELQFRGSLLLAVAQPSGFAAWVAKDIDEAIRKLPAAGFSAKVEMSHRRQVLRDLELALGNATFKGEIDSRQPDDAKQTVFVRLDGGALDLDGVAAFASLFVSDAGRSRFQASDFDFEIRAGPVSVAGLAAEHVDTALRLRDRQLEIDRLAIAGLAGASISATGSVKDFPESPTGTLDASIIAVDLAPLVQLAAANFPDNALLRQLGLRAARAPQLFSEARADIVASAAANDDGSTSLAVSLQGNAGGSALSGSLTATTRGGDLTGAPLSLSLSARNADAAVLLAAAGLPTLPVASLGGGELTVSAEGVAANGMKTRLELRGEHMQAAFEGTAGVGEDGATAKGALQLSTDDIEPWLMTTGASFPGIGFGLPVDLSAQADYASDLLVLNGIDGALGEVAVGGDLNADLKNGLPHLSGALVLDQFTLDPFAATVLGADALASEDGGWSRTPFAEKPMPPFLADIDLSAATLSAGNLDLFDATLGFRLDAEGLRIENLKAGLAGGRLTGQGELKNTAGTGLLDAQFKLAGANLATSGRAGGISGKADLSASVTGSAKSLDGLISSLAGSGSAHIETPLLRGIDPHALPDLLRRADAIGRDIDAAATAGFAGDVVGRGDFAGDPVDMALTLAGGVVRSPPLKVTGDAAGLSAELRVDLESGTADLSGSVVFDAGEDALVGSEPAVRFTVAGPVTEPTLTFDSEPLAQFLTQRALEREQARVEAMQASLMETQRLRREVRYYASLQAERERAAAEALRAAEEAARRKAIEDEQRRAAEKAARQAEEARARAEAAEAERLRLEQDAAKRRAAEEARRQAEQKAREAMPGPAEAVPVPEPRAEAGRFPPAPAKPLSDGFLEMLTGN
ncbi:MAG: AsmA protein [Rhizobiaceae bacterium]|nr:AsmA protein [Rhizobiaceae bacterium]